MKRMKKKSSGKEQGTTHMNFIKNLNFNKNRNRQHVSRIFHYKKIHIGLRTIKTVAAVLISMSIIIVHGLSTSKIIFAMLGAMAAMEHTFKESVEACLTQFVGMFFGAIAGMILISLPLYPLISVGIGIVLVITLYNMLHIRFSPSLPCLIVVTMCMTPDIQPLDYALGRLWASGIGLGVGLFINTLIYPYDNSSRIRSIIDYLDKEVILFLEDMFDGDNHLPNTVKMLEMLDDMKEQLKIFSEQTLLLREWKKRSQLETFETCAGKIRKLTAQMEVLCSMDYPGRLSDSNRELLQYYGAKIKDERVIDSATDLDIITNYSVEQILNLRQELIELLQAG